MVCIILWFLANNNSYIKIYIQNEFRFVYQNKLFSSSQVKFLFKKFNNFKNTLDHCSYLINTPGFSEGHFI